MRLQNCTMHLEKAHRASKLISTSGRHLGLPGNPIKIHFLSMETLAVWVLVVWVLSMVEPQWVLMHPLMLHPLI